MKQIIKFQIYKNYIKIKKMNTTERKLAATTREQSQTEKSSNSIKAYPIHITKYFNFLSSIQVKPLKFIK